MRNLDQPRPPWLSKNDAWAAPRPPRLYNNRVRFRIRQFKKADFDTLCQIDQVCFDPQLAYSRAEMAFYMRRTASFTLVAEADLADAAKAESGGAANAPGTVAIIETGSAKSPFVLGFIVAEVRRQTGHIITIDVVPDGRRSGVGSALLRAAEERLRAAGATSVALETAVNNEAAIRFYKQKGYFVEKTIRGYYSNQLDALVMTKELTTETQGV